MREALKTDTRYMEIADSNHQFFFAAMKTI